MADTIKSPNIIFSETDLSQVYVSQPSSDFVVIGGTPKGSYFIPTTIRNYNEYLDLFGGVSKTDYTGLTVKNLLNEATSVTVVPVANTEDYTAGKAYDIVATFNGETATVAQLFLSNAGLTNNVTAINATGTLEDFDLTFSSASVEIPALSVTGLSAYSTDTENYVGNYSNPKSTTAGFYVKYAIDPNLAFTGAILSTNAISIVSSSVSVTMSSYTEGLTPWVLSQYFNGTTNHRLFRFETAQQGDIANRTVKVEITNVRTAEQVNPTNPTYGVFDVLVRAYGDNDFSKQILERFESVNLNPESDRYIAKVIGDVKFVYDVSSAQVVETGIYRNRSKFLRVIMSDVDSIPSTAVPFGFERYDFGAKLFATTANTRYKTPVVGSGESAGVNFDAIYSKYIHSELPEVSSLKVVHSGTTGAFLMSNSNTFYSNDNSSPSDRSFTFGFYGATNGINPTTIPLMAEDITSANTMGFDFSTTASAGYLSFKRAIDIVSDSENVLFKFLVMPAINLVLHPTMCQYALNMAKAQKRGDILVILDSGKPTSTTGDIDTATQAFDSSFGGAFDPWYYVNDSEIGTKLVPISVLVPSAFAYTANVAKLWYGTFGYRRGKLENGLRPYRKRSLAQRDELYDSRVNSVSRVVGESSATIMGNKTLQVRDSSLSLINVRLLLNEAKRFVREVAKKYIGEPLTDILVAQLTEELNAYFETVRRDRGVSKFLVIFDDTVNNDDDRDMGILRGVIYLEPNSALKGLSVNFVITRSNGIQFSE